MSRADKRFSVELSNRCEGKNAQSREAKNYMMGSRPISNITIPKCVFLFESLESSHQAAIIKLSELHSAQPNTIRGPL